MHGDVRGFEIAREAFPLSRLYVRSFDRGHSLELLEKGVEMMKRTLALGERTGVASGWMKRAEAAKAEMDRALDEEKAIIKKFPFTEETLEKTLEIMKKKAADDAAKATAKKS